MVGAWVQSSGLCVQGPCQSRSTVEVSEVSEMARVYRRGLVGFGIFDIHRRTLLDEIQSLVTEEDPKEEGGRVWVPDKKDLRRRVLELYHDTPVETLDGRWTDRGFLKVSLSDH
jgi:hypothetical protein